jgi:hypothetical protein
LEQRFSLTLIEKLEIPLPTHIGRSHVTFDYCDIDFSIRGDDNRTQTPRLGKYHVIAFLPAQREPVLLKDTAKRLMRNWGEAPFIRLPERIVGHVVRDEEAQSQTLYPGARALSPVRFRVDRILHFS